MVASGGACCGAGDQNGRSDVSVDKANRDSTGGKTHGRRRTEAVPLLSPGDSGIIPMEEFQSVEERRQADRAATKRGAQPGMLEFQVVLNCGLALTALAIVVFKTPNGFAFGGTSGLSLILSTLLPQFPVSAFMWIINAALVVLGLIFLDRKTVGWSVFASFALSAYVSLFELIFPTRTSITGDMWLDLCFAVLLPALGSAMVFNVGASTGGTDILALILTRRTSLQVGRALMVVDIGIVCVAAVLFGPRVGLYCVLGLLAKTLVVDGVIENLRLRKVCIVISGKAEDIERFIVRKLNRSATITKGYGAYSGRRVLQIMSVLTPREAMRLRQYARTVDPGAFITIVNSSEIIGRGLRRA